MTNSIKRAEQCRGKPSALYRVHSTLYYFPFISKASHQKKLFFLLLKSDVRKSFVCVSHFNSSLVIFTVRNCSCGKVMFSQARVYPQGGICPGVLCVYGGSLSRGCLSGRPRGTVKSGRYASYWNASLFSNVRIKLQLSSEHVHLHSIPWGK